MNICLGKVLEKCLNLRMTKQGEPCWQCRLDAKAAGDQMVVGEADRRDRQLRHQVVADVDVVIPSQDQVQNIAADVGCRADVLSKSILDEHVSSAAVQLSSDRSWDIEVADNCGPAIQQSQLVEQVGQLVDECRRDFTWRAVDADDDDRRLTFDYVNSYRLELLVAADIDSCNLCTVQESR